MELEPQTPNPGDPNDFTHQLPNQAQTIVISLKDASDQLMMSWEFFNAYPVKWEFADLEAQGQNLGTESLEFAYQPLKKY